MLKKFNFSDIFINRIKTYPKTRILTHSGSVYYNNSNNGAESGVSVYDFLMVPPVLPLVAPDNPVRYIFDASDADSFTLEDTNRVVSWRSTGTNTTPAIQASGSALRPVYDSEDQSVRGNNESNIASYDLTIGASSIAPPNVATPNWHMFAIVNVQGVAGTFVGAPYDNDVIFSFAQFGGLFLKKNGGNYEVQGLVSDGSYKTALATGFQLNTRTLVEAKYTGTVVGAAINGESFTTTAAGASDTHFGWPTAIFRSWASVTNFNGKVHEILVFDDDLDEPTRTAWANYLIQKWSISV